MTEGAAHEVNPARTLQFKPDTIVAVDRGYTDFGLFNQWCERGVWFVTRCKANLDYYVIEDRQVPRNRNILFDQIIELAGPRSRAACPHRLRRVVVWDEAGGRSIELLTNHLGFGATTIAAMLRMNLLVYRDLWRWLDEPYTKPPDPTPPQLELLAPDSWTAHQPT